MLEDFESGNYIEKAKMQKELPELKEKINKTGGHIYYLENEKKELEQELQQTENEISNKKTLFDRIHKRKALKTLEEKAFQLRKEIAEIDKERVTTIGILDELTSRVNLVEQNQLPAFIHEDGKGLIISDETIDFIDKVKSPNVLENPENVVIVHSTNFFPRNHKILTSYDGNKETDRNRDITFDGITKFCRALVHRHTVHTTLNARVGDTGFGEGGWSSDKFMVIEPFKYHKEQYVCTVPSDAYTYGSIELSDDAVILVRDDAYDEIPEEEKNNYQIVRFSGNPTKCLENFLKLNGYEIFHTDPNAAHHAHSKYHALERALNSRDGFINYIRDNSYLSREQIQLSEDEIFTLCNIAKQNQNRVPSFNTNFQKFAEKNGISPEFLTFFVTSGFIPTSDGNFTFKTDEEIFEIISDIYESEYKYNYNLDSDEYENILKNHDVKIEDIKQYYDAYCEKEFKNLEETFDTYEFFKDNRAEDSDKTVFKAFQKEYRDKIGDKNHLNENELKRFYQIQHKKFLEREKYELEQNTLARKMSDFDLIYDEEQEDYIWPDVTDEEMAMYSKLLNSSTDRINKQLKEKGNDKYFFSIYKDSLVLMPFTDEAEEEINTTLEGKEHYIGKDEVYNGAVILDFKRKQDETLAEFLPRLESYAEQFSRYYNGETLDESIQFDEDGNSLKVQQIKEPAKIVMEDDFRKVAETKEAIEQLQSGNLISQISDEINLNHNDEQKRGELHD